VTWLLKLGEESGPVSVRLDRELSLSLVAAALEQLAGQALQQKAKIDALPGNLHEDAVDVLANVEHFIADSDIRGWDEGYRRMQEEHLSGLLRSLRAGAPREALLRFNFLSDLPLPSREQPFRDPSRVERELLGYLLSVECSGQQALVTQLQGIQVRRIDESGSLELRVAGGEPALVVDRVPVEGHTNATDGTQVHLDLHVVDGLLEELHICREDGEPVERLPTVTEL
jgi:hypothetical protein